MLACESDHEVGKAEYSLYLMKFANNKDLKDQLKFIERMIAQSIEFDLTVRLRDETFCPFTEMINKFPHEDTILKDHKLEQVVEAANENIEIEMKRIREFKINEANYLDKKDLLVKLPEEVF